MFPVFFGFRGGKGILSGGTIVLMLDWRVALVAWGLFVVLWLSTKYVSLGSITATASMPVTTFFVFSHNVLYTVLSAAIAVLCDLVPPRQYPASALRHGEKVQMACQSYPRG